MKRGLRNADGTGVPGVTGYISNVHGYVVSEGDKVPNRTYFLRGYDINDLVDHVVTEEPLASKNRLSAHGRSSTISSWRRFVR